MLAYFSSLKFSALLNQSHGGLALGLVWGIMALGVFMTFRMLDIADLTVDGSFATGGAVCIVLINTGMPPQYALLFAIAAGMLCGFVTGILHTHLGIPDILAGILTQISLYSINLFILGKANLAIPRGLQPALLENPLFPSGNELVLNRTILLVAAMCLLLVVGLYLYLGTEHGSALRATGINGNMARAQGINTNRMKVIGLALSNGLVALSGGVLAQYQGNADVSMGRGSIVIGLAAVIIGEVLGEALVGKRMNFMLRLAFVVIGSVIYQIVYAFVIWLKLPTDFMKLLTAVVVAIFLAVPNLRNAKKNSFSRLAKQNAKAGKEG